jgi:hypothetical protein
MEMQELTQIEVMEVSGGRRNLGSLYQYTGDPKDRTAGEIAIDMYDSFMDAATNIEKWLWRN